MSSKNKQAIQQVEVGTAKVPYIDPVTYKWLEYDEATQAYKDTGIDSRGIEGPRGNIGKSNYDLWVESGNAGSISDFLATLKGTKGDKGDPGQGIPTGGTANQTLVKNSAADHDMKWANAITSSTIVEIVPPMTQAQYDALGTAPNTDNKIYLIVG
jgi:hypothetical protein